MSKRFATRTPVRSAALAALLAAAPAASQAPYTGCSVPEAEAEVCPSFSVAPEDVGWAAISGDGSTLVGSVLVDSSNWMVVPARWIHGTLELLEPLPAWAARGRAIAASADGSVVVGHLSTSEPPWREVAFRWEDGIYEVLEAPDDSSSYMAYDVSADGRVTVGYMIAADVDTGWFAGALAWDDAGLRVLEEGASAAQAVSGDGSVIAGTSGSALPVLPVIWESGLRVDLPLAPGNTGGYAQGVTPDGSIVVGRVFGGAPTQAARWVGDSLELLGVEYSGGAFDSTFAWEVSADGSLVFGAGSGDREVPHGDYETEPFVWDAENGLRLLAAVLSEDLGVDLTNLNLDRVGWHGISDDGHLMVGDAREGDDLFAPTRSFFADLSPPVGTDIAPGRADNAVDLAREHFVSARIFGTELLDVDDVDVDALAFGPDAAPVERVFQPRDENGDGYPDLDVRFETGETGIAAGDTEACLSGRAMGLPFEVCGPVEATLFGFGPGSGAGNPGCGRGFEAALALPALLWLRRRGR